MQSVLGYSTHFVCAVRSGLLSELLRATTEHPNFVGSLPSGMAHEKSLSLKPCPGFDEHSADFATAVLRILAGVAAGLVATDDRREEIVRLQLTPGERKLANTGNIRKPNSSGSRATTTLGSGNQFD